MYYTIDYRNIAKDGLFIKFVISEACFLLPLKIKYVIIGSNSVHGSQHFDNLEILR